MGALLNAVLLCLATPRNIRDVGIHMYEQLKWALLCYSLLSDYKNIQRNRLCLSFNKSVLLDDLNVLLEKLSFLSEEAKRRSSYINSAVRQWLRLIQSVLIFLIQRLFLCSPTCTNRRKCWSCCFSFQGLWRRQEKAERGRERDARVREVPDFWSESKRGHAERHRTWCPVSSKRPKTRRGFARLRFVIVDGIAAASSELLTTLPSYSRVRLIYSIV